MSSVKARNTVRHSRRLSAPRLGGIVTRVEAAPENIGVRFAEPSG
jgi:hypothetical protein